MDNNIKIPITFEQAYSCLNINDEQKVHIMTFITPGFSCGVELELERIRKMLEIAANKDELFFFYIDRLKNTGHHIFAYDYICEEWDLIDCDDEKVELLKKALNLK